VNNVVALAASCKYEAYSPNKDPDVVRSQLRNEDLKTQLLSMKKEI
jgi:hypothetical protein